MLYDEKSVESEKSDYKGILIIGSIVIVAILGVTYFSFRESVSGVDQAVSGSLAQQGPISADSIPTTAAPLTNPQSADTAPVADITPKTQAPSSTASTPSGPERKNNMYKSAPPMSIDTAKKYVAVLDTSKGDITINLYAKEAPITVNNFVFLARSGFYNDTVFHRIVLGFMIQGGDPLGTGTGGPGYNIQDEPVTQEYTRGTIAMANTGRPNSGGSQFFIIHKNYPLPKSYTIFGRAVDEDSLKTVDAIAETPTYQNPSSGEDSSPTEKIFIRSIDIREE